MVWVQFLAPFLAAIVAAISVLAATSYQARLTRKRDEEIRTDAIVRETSELFLWLENCAVRLERAAYRLDQFADNCNSIVEPGIALNYANFRTLLTPIHASEARGQFHKLAKFPIQLGISVSYAVGILADEYNPRNSDVFRDDLPIGEREFKHWANICRQARDLIKVAQAQIADTMNKCYNTAFPMPSDLVDIEKRIQTAMVENESV